LLQFKAQCGVVWSPWCGVTFLLGTSPVVPNSVTHVS